MNTGVIVIDPTTSHTPNRGEYSYRAGDREECTLCPLGAECPGGDVINVGWGWWKSNGTSKQRDRLLFDTKQKMYKLKHEEEYECQPDNSASAMYTYSNASHLRATPKQTPGMDTSAVTTPRTMTSNNLYGGTARIPALHTCGSRCSNASEPGCVCKYTKHAQCNDIFGNPQTPFEQCIPEQTTFPQCHAAEISTPIKFQAVNGNYSDACSVTSSSISTASVSKCGGRTWGDDIGWSINTTEKKQQTENEYEWYTMDLGSVMDIAGIQILGHRELKEEYMTEFSLAVSTDLKNWTFFKNLKRNEMSNPSEHIISSKEGASSMNSIVLGRYVRIIPLQWNGPRVSLRSNIIYYEYKRSPPPLLDCNARPGECVCQCYYELYPVCPGKCGAKCNSTEDAGCTCVRSDTRASCHYEKVSIKATQEQCSCKLLY